MPATTVMSVLLILVQGAKMMSGGLPLDWNQIVETHAVRVFRVAHRILGSVQDAEDASQEAFLDAYRVGSTAEVKCWTGLLVRIATLRALDRLRRRPNFTDINDFDFAITLEPFDVVSANEQMGLLRQLVGQLPTQQAEVFVLFAFEQMNRSEVAEALGISLESVSTSLYKARKYLQARMNFLSVEVSNERTP